MNSPFAGGLSLCRLTSRVKARKLLDGAIIDRLALSGNAFADEEGRSEAAPSPRSRCPAYGSLSAQASKPCVVTYMTRLAWSIFRYGTVVVGRPGIAGIQPVAGPTRLATPKSVPMYSVPASRPAGSFPPVGRVGDPQKAGCPKSGRRGGGGGSARPPRWGTRDAKIGRVSSCPAARRLVRSEAPIRKEVRR